jgi:hypothetical protein
VRAADEVFEQAVLNGPKVVQGSRVFGNKGLVGSTFNRNIILIEAETKGAIPLRSVVNAFEAEAAAAGASRISIVGHAIINAGFLSPAVAQRFGDTFRLINQETVELTKVLACAYGLQHGSSVRGWGLTSGGEPRKFWLFAEVSG